MYRHDARLQPTLRLPQSRLVARMAAALRATVPAPPKQHFSPLFLLATLCCAALLMLWRADRHPTLGMHDLYPLYYGAQAWLQGGNAYTLTEVAPLSDQTHGIFLTGNGYPFPAVLLVLPLSLLSPQAAGTVWIGLLTAGLLLALRLHGSSPWLILYWPLLEAIRLEQYTAFVVVVQLLTLWAYRERRPWLLGLCCSLALTKPTQGALFVLALLVLTRQRVKPLIMIAAVWSSTLLLDPTWPWEWLAGVRQYNAIALHPYYWWLALFAVPLFLTRNVIGGAIIASYSLFRFPLPAPYMAGMLPLGLLDDRRVIWLVPISYGWWFLVPFVGYGWSTMLALFLPLLGLVGLRWYEERSTTPTPRSVLSDNTG